MKAHELVKFGKVKFRLKNGQVLWENAHMNGDRRRICISREYNGKIYKNYIKPHTEVVLNEDSSINLVTNEDDRLVNI